MDILRKNLTEKVVNDFEPIHSKRNLKQADIEDLPFSSPDNFFYNNGNRIGTLSATIEDQVSIDNEVLTFSGLDREGTYLTNPWKLVSVFPARITGVFDYGVTLEVLIDDDLVEEQEYEMIFFEGFDLEAIQYFKIKVYERAREQRLVMVDGSDSLSRDDFPKIDFSHLTNQDIFF